jgi:endonuclease YncB( thermonuclease family)
MSHPIKSNYVTPPPAFLRFHSSKLTKKQKISEYALPIRVCTIDTPETAKFGKTGQPFGEEAKSYLSSLIENKTIRIRLLQKDQYGRAVAQVQKPVPLFQKIFWFFMKPKYVDELLLKQGLAEVYVRLLHYVCY